MKVSSEGSRVSSSSPPPLVVTGGKVHKGKSVCPLIYASSKIQNMLFVIQIEIVINNKVLMVCIDSKLHIYLIK